MQIKQVITIFAALAFATSSAMAQQPEVECGTCLGTQMASVSECRDIDLNGNPDPSKLDAKQVACFCKLGSNLSIWDPCSSKCPAATISTIKTTYQTYNGVICGSNAQGGSGSGNPKSGSAALSVPKVGAALVAVAAVVQAVM